jgi:sulfate transport system permease protein
MDPNGADKQDMTAIESAAPLQAMRRGTGPRRPFLRRRSAIPGFGVTLGVTLTVLSLVVLIPLSAVAIKASGLGLEGFAREAFTKRALHAYALSFGAALLAAGVNGVFGVLTAWALVRYDFPGKAMVGALVDLPFALPTAVAGISLATLYAPNGLIGAALAKAHVQAAYNPAGVAIALTFIGLPFVVRTLEPVMRDLSAEVEEAAASLGASRWQTLMRVVLPQLAPAWLTGVTLAFARAVGEYGSVIFIAGNRPFKSEIAPLLIVIQLEQFNYQGAAAIALTLLLASFLMLLAINAVQAWTRRFQ